MYKKIEVSSHRSLKGHHDRMKLSVQGSKPKCVTLEMLTSPHSDEREKGTELEATEERERGMSREERRDLMTI